MQDFQLEMHTNISGLDPITANEGDKGRSSYHVYKRNNKNGEDRCEGKENRKTGEGKTEEGKVGERERERDRKREE